MEQEDLELRKALLVSSGLSSSSDARDEHSSALLNESVAGNLSDRNSNFEHVFAQENSFEQILSTFFMTSEERERLKYKKLSNEDLRKLYNSPIKRGDANLTGFEKLRKFHSIAPPTFIYNPSTPLRTLLQFRGTILELLLQRPDFWLLFLFHITLSVVYYGTGNGTAGGVPTAHGWPPVGVAIVAVPGALITFTLVFYLNQTFTRYLSQQLHVMSITGLLTDFILMLRVHFHDEAFEDSRKIRHQLCKFANSMHFIAYASLPQNRNERVNEWTWWYLEHTRLLTENQVETLRPLQNMGVGSFAYKELIMWTQKGIWAQHSKTNDNRSLNSLGSSKNAASKSNSIPVEVVNLFTSILLEIRSHVDGLYTFESGTVPFAYFHLLNLTILLYLFVLSYSFVFVTPYWSIPGFFLILVGILGIREIGNKLSDPLGSDKTDLPVFDEAHKFLIESTVLINKNVSYEDELDSLKPNYSNFDQKSRLPYENISYDENSKPNYSNSEHFNVRSLFTRFVH